MVTTVDRFFWRRAEGLCLVSFLPEGIHLSQLLHGGDVGTVGCHQLFHDVQPSEVDVALPDALIVSRLQELHLRVKQQILQHAATGRERIALSLFNQTVC